jgi:hypothetical protein
MTHMVEPHDAALDNHDDGAVDDGELASLVRRWVGARRSGAVRIAAAPEGGPDDTRDGDEGDVLAMPDLSADVSTDVADVADVSAEPVTRLDPDVVGFEVTEEQFPRLPALPHRPAAEDTERAPRVAVLIDARRVSEDVAAGLLTRLGDRGSVDVCRAYADWRRADLGTWVERLRRQGLHSFHQFAETDDQALVALAIDAVDIARESSVDEVVLAGDMTSMLPLVHRLHGAGVRVLVVGPAHTPHDVRAACDEFLDEDWLLGEPATPAGRHRA